MIEFNALETRLMEMWGRKSELTIIDVFNNYYVIKFNSMAIMSMHWKVDLE